jgi:hypothetical protein
MPRSSKKGHSKKSRSTRRPRLPYRKWLRFLRKYALVLRRPEKLRLNDESEASMAVFRRMAGLGFLTMNSQEGRREDPPERLPTDASMYNKSLKKRKGHEKEYIKLGGKYRKNKEAQSMMTERAYVEGLMSQDLAELFIHYINKTDKIGFIFNKGVIPVTYSYSNMRSNTTVVKRLPHEVPWATSQRLVNLKPSLAELVDAQPTWTDADLNQIPLLAHLKRARKKLAKYDPRSIDYVVCIDPRHGRLGAADDGLFTDVLRSLEAARQALAAVD